MTDQLERDLITLFHDRASETDASPVPLDRLVQQGEAATAAHRRRTRLVAVGAVAAAVVLAVAIPLGFRSLTDDPAPAPADVPEVVNTSTERPESVEGLPIGDPPAVPYAVDDTLHFRGQEYDIPAGTDFFTSASGTVVLVDGPSNAEWEDGERTTLVSVLRDGEVVPLARGPYQPPALSTDGTTIAVLAEPNGTARVETFDIDSGEEVAFVSIDDPRPRIGSVGVDDNGRVFAQNGPQIIMLSRDGDRRAVSVPARAQLAAVTPDGIIVSTASEYQYGSVSPEGRFQRLSSAEPPGSAVTTFRTDGAALAYSTRAIQGEDDLGTVVDLTTGETTELLVPEDVDWTLVKTFEGGQNVLLMAALEGEIAGQAYLRCSITTGACDRILTDLNDNVAFQFDTREFGNQE